MGNSVVARRGVVWRTDPLSLHRRPADLPDFRASANHYIRQNNNITISDSATLALANKRYACEITQLVIATIIFTSTDLKINVYCFAIN